MLQVLYVKWSTKHAAEMIIAECNITIEAKHQVLLISIAMLKLLNDWRLSVLSSQSLQP